MLVYKATGFGYRIYIALRGKGFYISVNMGSEASNSFDLNAT